MTALHPTYNVHLTAAAAAFAEAPGAVREKIAVALPDARNSKIAPADIQWMPPGQHRITGTQNGQPAERTVLVDAAAAAAMQGALESMLEAAARREGDRPFFDFNHEDNRASAHPAAFYWGGTDPETGGIRAKVEWTDEGRAAVLGRAYRRFSPSFYLDEAGHVIGAPVNMGGLVNRAAFLRIAPIWARAADADEPASNLASISPIMGVLANLGFIARADENESAAIAQIHARSAELTAGAAELTSLRSQLDAARAELTQSRSAHAQRIVCRAVAEGRLPGRDDAIRARWTALLEADPANETLLPDPHPALRNVLNASESSSKQNRAAEPAAHPFLTRAREIAAAENISHADALTACGMRDPDLYRQYRDWLREQPAARQESTSSQ